MGDALARVLGVPGKSERLGAVERHARVHLARAVTVYALERRLLRRLGLHLLRRVLRGCSIILPVNISLHTVECGGGAPGAFLVVLLLAAIATGTIG